MPIPLHKTAHAVSPSSRNERAISCVTTKGDVATPAFRAARKVAQSGPIRDT